MRVGAVILVVLASSAPTSAETRPHYGGDIEASLLGAPATFDPVLAQTHAELTVVEMIFDTLYRPGGDGLAEPHLALGLPVIDVARQTARITVRKGIKLHDGSELTAADVAASLERLRNGPVTARWVLAAVSGIRADGDGVELVLRAPVPDLAALLALPQTSITRAGKAPGATPIGSGAFAFVSIDRTQHVLVLKAFDDHFAGRPYLDRLVLYWYDTPDAEARRFETGAAQLSARGAAEFVGAQPKYRAEALEGPPALLVFVGVGRAHPDLAASRAFRHALDLAFARGALTTIGSGERVLPTRLPISVEAGAPALDPRAGSADLDRARAALGEAGRSVPALAPDKLAALRLEIVVEDTRPDDREIAERVVGALDKLNIEATITALPADKLRDRVGRGACDFWIGQLAAPVTLTAAWWASAFGAGGDDWAQQRLAAGSLDPAVAAKEFADRLPIVPLMFRAVRIWHRSDVRGLEFDPSGRPGLADLYLFGDPVRSKGSKP